MSSIEEASKAEETDEKLRRKIEALDIPFDPEDYRRYVAEVDESLRPGRTPLSYLIYKAIEEGHQDLFLPEDFQPSRPSSVE